jgi:hypothetical protein
MTSTTPDEIHIKTRLAKMKEHFLCVVSLFMRVFGFKTHDVDRALDFRASFYRFVNCKDGYLGYMIILSALCFAQAVAFSVSVSTFWEVCAHHELSSPTDPNCDIWWIGPGQNQVSLGVLIFLLLKVYNGVCYNKVDVSGNPYDTITFQTETPWPAKIEWILFQALLPLSHVSGFFYYQDLKGAAQTTRVQADKVIPIVTMVILGLFGMQETRLQHIMFSTFVVQTHVTFIVLVAELGGPYVYSPMETLNFRDIALGTMQMTVLTACFHFIYVVIFRLKLFTIRERTFMRIPFVPEDMTGLSEPKIPDPRNKPRLATTQEEEEGDEEEEGMDTGA